MGRRCGKAQPPTEDPTLCLANYLPALVAHPNVRLLVYMLKSAMSNHLLNTSAEHWQRVLLARRRGDAPIVVRSAAALLDAGSPVARSACANAKRVATDLGFSVCDRALQLHGGYGYLQDYPIEKLVRDTRVHRILEGTNQVMRIILSRALLE